MHATLPLLKATDFPPVTPPRARDAAGQSRLHVQPGLPALPRQCEPRPQGDDGEGDDRPDSRACSLGAGIATLDVTGGAPELNPHFRHLVREARALGVRVIDRCNLTVLNEPGFEDLADFLARNGVEIIASLPCYTKENVDRQRGDHVFESSILALRKLNALGYGRTDTGLVLNLVYNPLGPTPAAGAGRARGRPTSASSRRISASCSIGSTRSPTCRSRVSARL